MGSSTEKHSNIAVEAEHKRNRQAPNKLLAVIMEACNQTVESDSEAELQHKKQHLHLCHHH